MEPWKKFPLFTKKILRFSKKPPKSLINTLHHSDVAKKQQMGTVA
jgi:hypothetical protein